MKITISSALPGVASFYNLFPYPNYPLWLPLNWKQAYLNRAGFSWSLANYRPSKQTTRILIAGCGDTSAYIHRKLEPSSHVLDACDLSKRNLSRSKIRLLMSTRKVNWICENILNFSNQTQHYDHIECIGVLHHMHSPKQGLQSLSGGLKPGATMRLMVYNPQAREWIWQVRKIFQHLNIDPFYRADLKLAKLLLLKIQTYLKNFPAQYQTIKNSLSNDSSFVDRFLHPIETRIDFRKWIENFEASELELLGIFDRYAELDDLENPLWRAPKPQEILDRCYDLRFENNFEFFLRKKTPLLNKDGADLKYEGKLAYPRSWFSFNETRKIPIDLRYRLLGMHLNCLNKDRPSLIDPIFKDIGSDAFKRLCRIGAILPSQIESSELFELGKQRLQTTMHANKVKVFTSVPLDLKKFILQALDNRGIELIRWKLIEARLEKIAANI